MANTNITAQAAHTHSGLTTNFDRLKCGCSSRKTVPALSSSIGRFGSLHSAAICGMLGALSSFNADWPVFLGATNHLEQELSSRR